MIVPYAEPIPALLETPGVAQPIMIERYTGAWANNGLWQRADKPTVITRRGIIYPSSADDLAALPEGERTEKSITLYWRLGFQVLA